ncbi:MAG: substrate-binding domain-containing protein [Candidatus Limnocylindria bacterium]
MTNFTTAVRTGLALVAAAALLLAACSSPPASGQPSGEGVTGEIYVSGSSTVEPISNSVAEKFQDANPDFDYVVEGPGTGDGFAKFCQGQTDISDASRAIKDEEVQACGDNGVEYVELKIAFDGLSVITSSENADVECLSFLDLYALLGPESENFETWSDANSLAAELAADLGSDYGASHAPYPDAPLAVTAPGEESGTFDSFVEIAVGKIAGARNQDVTTRPDYTASANDNVIIEGIGGTASSLGWVGLAFADGAGDQIKEIAIDRGDGCVAPSAETVSDGSYPIARPLFIYVNLARAAANAAVVDYVDFYLSDEGIASVAEVGYVDLPADQLAATRSTWDAR